MYPAPERLQSGWSNGGHTVAVCVLLFGVSNRRAKQMHLLHDFCGSHFENSENVFTFVFRVLQLHKVLVKFNKFGSQYIFPPTPWSNYILPVAILFTAKKGISKRIIKTWVQNHDLSSFQTGFVVSFCILKVFIAQVATFVLGIWPILKPGSTQWSFSPIVHVLGWQAYLEHPEETHLETGKTCKLHNSRIQYLAVRSLC